MTLDRVVATLSARVQTEGHSLDVSRLREAVLELTRLLALGPEPEVRDCPFCGQIIRREATRCGYCWQVISPSSDARAPRPDRDAEAIWENEGGHAVAHP